MADLGGGWEGVVVFHTLQTSTVLEISQKVKRQAVLEIASCWPLLVVARSWASGMRVRGQVIGLWLPWPSAHSVPEAT